MSYTDEAPNRSSSENEDTENCLIREDRIWEYYEYVGDLTSGYNWSINRYKFDGTEEKYGKTYHRWCATDRDFWGEPIGQLPNGEWDWGVQTERIDRCEALLREDAGIVYLLVDDSEVSNYDPESKTFEKCPAEEGREVILYDFNLEAGDKGKSFIEHFHWDLHDCSPYYYGSVIFYRCI